MRKTQWSNEVWSDWLTRGGIRAIILLTHIQIYVTLITFTAAHYHQHITQSSFWMLPVPLVSHLSWRAINHSCFWFPLKPNTLEKSSGQLSMIMGRKYLKYLDCDSGSRLMISVIQWEEYVLASAQGVYINLIWLHLEPMGHQTVARWAAKQWTLAGSRLDKRRANTEPGQCLQFIVRNMRTKGASLANWSYLEFVIQTDNTLIYYILIKVAVFWGCWKYSEVIIAYHLFDAK